MKCWTLALEKLNHHLFSTPDHDNTVIDHITHDLVLWLNHHSFEELPDALEYNLADPNCDLEADLANLNFLDQWGVQVNIHPIITIYLCTLLAWAMCFLATYGVYPGLYDPLDTLRHDFLAAQLYLHDSTFPRPLLPQSRGPPTLQNECVALQPHLAPPTTPNHLYICRATHMSITMSVCHATSLSIIPPAPSVCPLTCPHIELSSVIWTHPSVAQPVHQSVNQPISQSHCLSITQPVCRPSLSICHMTSLSTIPSNRQ